MYSPHLYACLTLPLVPLELVRSGLFLVLKLNNLICEVDKTIAVETLSGSVLSLNELLMMLSWLRVEQHDDKEYIRRVLSVVQFRENVNSPVIPFCQIKHYDVFHIPSLLSLPPNVLPNSIAIHFSSEDLQFNFFLTAATIKELFEFYSSKNQKYLLEDPRTSEYLFRLFSKHSSQITDNYWIRLKEILSDIKCISTNQGMKLPSESYLPSSLITSDLRIVAFKLSCTVTDNDDRNFIEDDTMSVSFLKRIGCRIFNVQSLVKVLQDLTSTTLNAPAGDTMRALIFQLMEERPNMNEADFKSIKENRVLKGLDNFIFFKLTASLSRNYNSNYQRKESVITTLHMSFIFRL